MLEGHHGGGLCIPRARLDAVLVEQAVASGCELQRQAFTAVTPGAPGLEGFDLVVDARGSAAGPVNAVGLRGYWTLPRSALGEDSPLDADFARQAHEVSIRTTARHRRGYGWVFPTDVRDDRVTFNLGVGLWKADIKPGDGPREMLARFLAADPLAGMLERLAVERSHPQGFPLAMGGWSTPRVGSGRWARIGDAAALADPLTGDGIGNALLSGRLLAQAVAEARPEPRSGTTGAPATGGRAPCPDPGDAWQTLFEAKLRPELRRAWLLRQALVPVAAKNGAAWLLDRAPQTVRQKLHQALFGALTYREALF
jgi:flavin-dependent dehydrogenase